jgi:hypothetical protein
VFVQRFVARTVEKEWFVSTPSNHCELFRI